MRPLDQKSVSLEDQASLLYVRLYKMVTDAKKAADKNKKKLIILVGESHKNAESLMYELILLDIAQRIGISDFAVEFDASRATQEVQAAENILEGNQAIKAVNLPLKNKKFVLDSSLLMLSAFNDHALDWSQIVGNATYTLLTGINAGMTCHGADPFHDARGEILANDQDFAVSDRDKDLKAKHEKAMADVVNSISKPCIAFFGTWHLMPIYNSLLKGKNEILVVNSSPDVDVNTPTERNKKIFKSRIEPLKQFYQPKLNGQIIPLPSAVWRTCLTASQKHQLHRGEISKRDFQINMEALQYSKTLAAGSPPSSSGHLHL